MKIDNRATAFAGVPRRVHLVLLACVCSLCPFAMAVSQEAPEDVFSWLMNCRPFVIEVSPAGLESLAKSGDVRRAGQVTRRLVEVKRDPESFAPLLAKELDLESDLYYLRSGRLTSRVVRSAWIAAVVGEPFRDQLESAYYASRELRKVVIRESVRLRQIEKSLSLSQGDRRDSVGKELLELAAQAGAVDEIYSAALSGLATSGFDKILPTVLRELQTSDDLAGEHLHHIRNVLLRSEGFEGTLETLSNDKNFPGYPEDLLLDLHATVKFLRSRGALDYGELISAERRKK